MATPHPTTLDPDGRVVAFDAGTVLHLALGRPDFVDEVELILGIVAHPDHHEDDPLAGRERYYRRHLDRRRWLRVVVDFNVEPAWIVTAFVQTYSPQSWRT